MIAAALTPIIPIAFAFLLPLFSIICGYRKRLIQLYALVGTGLTLWAAVKLFEATFASSVPLIYTFGNWHAPIGIVYEVDRLSALLALLIAVLMFLIAVYSVEYLRAEEGISWYFTLYLGLEAGLLGAVLTGDAFNFFVMIEVTSITAYGLVAFYRRRRDAVAASLKYAFIGALGTTLYFLALGVFYGAFGTVNLADLSAKVHGFVFPITNVATGNIVLASGLALALAMWAFLIKAAIVPNHFWLPEAHPAAPSPISAILSGLVVNIGIYAIIRFLFTVYGTPLDGRLQTVVNTLRSVLMALGAISAIFAALTMTVQTDIKRLIAYSTIMHMGYLVMAVSLGTMFGLQAAVFHLVNHALAKALLFLAAGVVIHAAGSRNLAQLKGMGRHMPLTSFALTVGALALIGVPPFNVFFSKLALMNCFIESSPAAAVVLVLSSAIALVAYTKVFYTVWLENPKSEPAGNEPTVMSSVVLFLALLCLALGIIAPMIFGRFIEPTAAQVIDFFAYIHGAL